MKLWQLMSVYWMVTGILLFLSALTPLPYIISATAFTSGAIAEITIYVKGWDASKELKY